MRKLTVLLLSGALLAITGGASVARGGEFAMLECSLTFLPLPAPGWAVGRIDTSFDTPEECVGGIKSCSKCAAAMIQSGHLKLVDTSLTRTSETFGDIQMVFTESIAGDDDKDRRKHRGRDKDDD